MSIAAELESALESRIATIAATLEPGVLGVCVHDYLSRFRWQYNGARWFHAASLIKLAILAAVFDAIDRGRFTTESRVHLRNRFLSAVDGLPFRVQQSRDADSDVHAAIGRTMRVDELARHMITTSSNLASNLLLDVAGCDEARRTIERLGLVSGIDLRRGVEDDRAFEAGLNNRVTAEGIVDLLRAFRDGAFSAESSEKMTAILLDQQFTGGIAPGLPDPVRQIARVAHKTGEISTVSHDAGFVFLPGRPPYVLAILVESDGEAAQRTLVMAEASRAVYDAVSAAGESG